MDYKEKYEQAMLRMNKWVEGSEIIDPKEVAEFVFPELRESEDKRIRKALIHYFSEQDGILTAINGSVSVGDVIAWLEKQEDANKEYWRGYREGKQEIIDKYSELEKQGEQKPNFCHHEVDFSNCSEEYRKAYYDGWNNCNQQHAQLEAEQKPAWSEDDERNVHGICMYLMCSDSPEGYTDWINWLKSIKDKVQPKPKQEWSEDDEEMFDAIIADIQFTQKAHNHEVNQVVYEREIDWLKSLKERYTWKPSDEQMNLLEYLVEDNNQRYFYNILRPLYEQLKKLKG